MGIKTVQDSSLTAIADAIRAKTGKSASMEFPTEFVSEIGSISGGGSGYFELLEEITVAEDVRAVNIDLTDYSGYRDLIIVENVTLSASDWMYYVNNGTSPSGGSYDNSSITKTGVCFAWFETTTGDNYNNIKPSANSYNITSGKINNFLIYTYSSSKMILTGSKFQIYGRRSRENM